MWADLWIEVRDALVIITLIAYVVLAADIYNRQVFWHETYSQWEVNEDCPIPDGFDRALVSPDKKRPKHLKTKSRAVKKGGMNGKKHDSSIYHDFKRRHG